MWWSSGRPRGRGSPARTSAAECSLRRAPAGAPAVAPLCRASAVALLCRASAVAGGAGMRQGERGLAVELAHLRQQLLLAEVLQLHRGADGRVRERGDHYAGEQADRHQQRERAHAADDDGVGQVDVDRSDGGVVHAARRQGRRGRGQEGHRPPRLAWVHHNASDEPATATITETNMIRGSMLSSPLTRTAATLVECVAATPTPVTTPPRTIR